ncbi:hypothetical protein BKE38_03460 [Pseudoroseomonas deserti]|uniref:Uncharacterized protein n=1 Tax=Teichococcus deserti TaxID=1817963 RepID=A0A1V2H7S1_9PROT|nr:hypothetical protein [Pseudoroseomonas deserti]ONG58159.1 hypothetical protein BKE38_03460 [Pseudoroseomonas deserti]
MSSNAHPPPVPPANRAPQGDKTAPREAAGQERRAAEQEAQGRSQNLAQNTRHQGHQQDR